MSRLTRRNSKGEAYCTSGIGAAHFGREIEKLAHYLNWFRKESMNETGRDDQ